MMRWLILIVTCLISISRTQRAAHFVFGAAAMKSSGRAAIIKPRLLSLGTIEPRFTRCTTKPWRLPKWAAMMKNYFVSHFKKWPCVYSKFRKSFQILKILNAVRVPKPNSAILKHKNAFIHNQVTRKWCQALINPTGNKPWCDLIRWSVSKKSHRQ